MLRAFDHRVVTCWVLLAQILANKTQHIATHRNTVAKRTQHVAPNNVGIIRLCWHVAIVWPGLSVDDVKIEFQFQFNYCTLFTENNLT